MKEALSTETPLQLDKMGPTLRTPSAATERPQAPTVSLREDLAELTKLRLTTLVLITTVVGFLYGSGDTVNWAGLFNTLIATGLVAAGAAALNQVLEIRQDRLMKRTADRPLPAGRMATRTATLFGTLISLIGLIYLGLAANWLTSALAALTLAVYVLIYTPLKQKTVHNTLIGAISGAIPPVLGWTAATGKLGVEALILFGILFFWQMPHFLAIAWMYRDQYRKAGFRMWPLIDKLGRWTAGQSFFFSLLLLGVSLTPVFLGLNNWVYGGIASLLGVGMTLLALRFLCHKTEKSARQLFLSTLLYLPAILIAIVFTTT